MLFEIDFDKKSSYPHLHRWENFKKLGFNFREMVWHMRVVGGWVIFFFLTHTAVLSGLSNTTLWILSHSSERGSVTYRKSVDLVSET